MAQGVAPRSPARTWGTWSRTRPAVAGGCGGEHGRWGHSQRPQLLHLPLQLSVLLRQRSEAPLQAPRGFKFGLQILNSLGFPRLAVPSPVSGGWWCHHLSVAVSSPVNVILTSDWRCHHLSVAVQPLNPYNYESEIFNSIYSNNVGFTNEDTANAEITQNDGQKGNLNVSVMFSVVPDDSAAGACLWLLRMRRDSGGKR
ncbi:hypothetical protein C4D60_Mb02t00720 [Musa balbisiana]|uniref:Uncharacterized protein n=1 Tax=Musa balbisiana TaxID=52838 RepID=A0A4S8I7A5_MUSBA|nr:hypothetical protein C4D60_Mb02t00720 [Musa balbisiana]